MLSAELAERASRYYLVAEDDGEVSGYGGLMAAGWQGDVLTLAVAPGHWGQGIGSALLRALLAEAARRGCTEVFLEVRSDNDRAQRLYLRHGFRPAGIRRGYYQPSGADALVMRLPLGAAGAAGGRRRGDGGITAPEAAPDRAASAGAAAPGAASAGAAAPRPGDGRPEARP
jgi:ribosomal-protein-alanine N-acetyltransferase